MIVDAHSDVEFVRDPGRDRSVELVLRRGGRRLFDRCWLPGLEAGGVGVQVCPLYAANVSGHEARERVLAQVVEFGRAVEANAARVCQVRTRAELGDPRLRLVLSMEPGCVVRRLPGRRRKHRRVDRHCPVAYLPS